MSFLSDENVSTLWDVISDEQLFRYLPPDNQARVRQVFLANIQGFSQKEGMRSPDLVSMNKKFILLILDYIQKHLMPQLPKKIQILGDTSVPLTAEEIQQERQTAFDRDLHMRQRDFTDSMSVKPPQVPNFQDEVSETPIKDMERILREMAAQRKYEVDHLVSPNNIAAAETWLSPQETSLKPSLAETKKNVSWGHTEEIIPTASLEEMQDMSIFAKLKKKDPPPSVERRLEVLETQMQQLLAKVDVLVSAASSSSASFAALSPLPATAFLSSSTQEGDGTSGSRRSNHSS